LAKIGKNNWVNKFESDRCYVFVRGPRSANIALCRKRGKKSEKRVAKHNFCDIFTPRSQCERVRRTSAKKRTKASARAPLTMDKQSLLARRGYENVITKINFNENRFRQGWRGEEAAMGKADLI
jgi:hypothetical protein